MGIQAFDSEGKELPPRARRILTFQLFRHPFAGTTSACAENTVNDGEVHQGAGNYLRVRGEYQIFSKRGMHSLELPPRARRIRVAVPLGPIDQGTTSACAENTAAV